jgi:hypothetical protein
MGPLRHRLPLLSVFSLALFSSFAAFADSYPPIESTLETPGYTVTIVSRCEEPSLLCNNVTYTGVSRKTNRKITMRGSKAVRYCSGGQAPCEALGYQFVNGNYFYEVRLDGRLIVTNIKSGKVLVEETGKWITK